MQLTKLVYTPNTSAEVISALLFLMILKERIQTSKKNLNSCLIKISHWGYLWRPSLSSQWNLDKMLRWSREM